MSIEALIPGNVTLQLYPVQTSLQLQIAAGGRGPKGDTAGLEVSESPVDSGIDTRVLFNNNGKLGEYAVSGTGSVAMTNSPTFVTPALGTPTSGLLNATSVIAQGSSAARTLADRFGELVNVKDYGAVGDGVANDTAAFQAAAAALTEYSVFYMPAGRYVVYQTVEIVPDNVTIAGHSQQTTRILFGNSTDDLFRISGDFIQISGFLVQASGVASSGTLFELEKGANSYISNLFTDGGYNIINFGTDSGQIFVSDCVLNNNSHNTIYLGAAFHGAAIIRDIHMFTSGDNDGSGIEVLGGEGGTFEFARINITNHAYPIKITAAENQAIYDIHFEQVFADGVDALSGGPGWWINALATGSKIYRIGLVDCWAGTRPHHGFFVQGDVQQISLHGCWALANSFHGVYFAGAPSTSHILINGMICAGNSLGNNNVYDGIHIADHTYHFSILNCESGPSGHQADTQRYGIAISGGNHDNYIVKNNRLAGNLTGGLLDEGVGTNKVVSDNVGAATVAEIVIASASTTNIGAVNADTVSITGTTTITSFGSAPAGLQRKGRFTGALTLTHNATSLILPGGLNITTAAGDRFVAYSLGSGNWLVVDYIPAGVSQLAASDTIRGPVELATAAEVAAGTDTLRAVTPSSLAGWTSYTPVVTAESGSFADVAASGYYKVIAGVTYITLTISIIDNGTAAGSVFATLPNTSGSGMYFLFGRDTALHGNSLSGTINPSASSVTVKKQDNTYPGGTGAVLGLQGFYLIQ